MRIGMDEGLSVVGAVYDSGFEVRFDCNARAVTDRAYSEKICISLRNGITREYRS